MGTFEITECYLRLRYPALHFTRQNDLEWQDAMCYSSSLNYLLLSKSLLEKPWDIKVPFYCTSRWNHSTLCWGSVGRADLAWEVFQVLLISLEIYGRWKLRDTLAWNKRWICTWLEILRLLMMLLSSNSIAITELYKNFHTICQHNYLDKDALQCINDLFTCE